MKFERTFMSIKLHYNTQRIKKDGTAGLYLRVIINREKKDFPLKLDWPVERIDLKNQILLAQGKRDTKVDDYNLLIDADRAKFTEIQITYRIRKEDLNIDKLAREFRIFNEKECFASYLELERNRRYKRKEIEKNTWQNAHATKMAMLSYDQTCLFKNINRKWMNGFKTFLRNKGYMPGTIWAKMACVKAYLRLAGMEPLIFVDEGALNFPNPKTKVQTTYLNVEELRRLIIMLEGDLTNRQLRVLEAFLFTCFTSLRISDVYAANSQWEVQQGFLDFVPHKNRKRGQKIRIPLIPIAKALINRGVTYFDLPNMVQYNETLKELAEKAGIIKNLTSHVGRHTFGFLYMTNTENIYGLQQVLGHSKLETTERYAHLDDNYKMESTAKIQNGFADLMKRIEKEDRRN